MAGTRQKKEATNEGPYNGADASKQELLRAMDARLTALHQEQHMAFSHATAAGFDNNNISNLMTFAEHFGADRLKDACTHFVTLSTKRAQRDPASTPSPDSLTLNFLGDVKPPSEEPYPPGPKRRLDFGAGKVQRNHSVPGSGTWKAPTAKDDPCNSIRMNGDLPSSAERSSSLPAPIVGDEVHLISNSSPADTQIAADSRTMAKDGGSKPAETPCMESDDSRSQGVQEERRPRRLSVQAAISLFESKKDSNDTPFQKLAKQDSTKKGLESATSPSEKFVLKRWSVPSPRGQEELDKKPTVSGLEKTLEPGVKKVQEEVSKVCSSASDSQQPTTAAADPRLRENFKRSLNELLHHDNNNKRTGRPNMEMQPGKQSVSPVHRHLSDTITGSRVDPELKELKNHQVASHRVIHVTSTQEVASQVRAPPPPPPPPPLGPAVPATIKPFKASANKEPNLQPMASTPSIERNEQNEQEDRHKVDTKVPNTTGLLPKRANLSSQRLKGSAQVFPLQMPVQSSSEHNDSEPTISAAAPATPEQTFGKRADTTKLQERPGSDRQLTKSTSYGKTPVERKERSLTSALNTSVDIHMQALVKMVEHHQYTNLGSDGMGIQGELKGEGKQKGRLYEQYSKLRDAKLRREHPAKKADREAKLKAMQETLERRKAEMEYQVAMLSKNKTRGILSGANTQPGKAAMADQIDLKDKGGCNNQEESAFPYQPFSYNSPTSPTSMPYSTKNQSLLKSCAPTNTLPALTKPVCAPRNPIRDTNSSPKFTPKSLNTAPSQGKAPSPGDTNAATSKVIKAALDIKEVTKTSVIRVAESARVYPRSNSSSNDGVFHGDEGGSRGITEKKEPRLMTRKTAVSPSISKSLSLEVGTLPENPKDQHEGATDLPTGGKGPQDAKPFLRKGQGIGPGAGPGAMKHKASSSVYNSTSSDGPTSIADKEDGIALDFEEHKAIAEYPDYSGRENSDIRSNEWDAVVASSVPMECRVDDESKSPDSQLCASNSVDMVALGYLSGSDKICHDNTIGLVEEPHEATFIEDTNSETQGSFLTPLCHKGKEGSHLLPQHKACVVKSSLSFREVSLQDSRTGSPFSTSASNYNPSLLQRDTLLNRFSPPQANTLDLPKSSPALWHAMQGSKYADEPGRAPSSGTYKHASSVPLPPKDPSKGLKRLLHFGRKSRQSETAMADCVSVSTTSEGDDDIEEVQEFGSQLPEEVMRKITMQKRGFEYGNIGDHYSSPHHGPSPSRSFFSISPFRSKGGEAKAK